MYSRLPQSEPPATPFLFLPADVLTVPLLMRVQESMAADAAPADTAGIEDVEHHELPSNLNTMEAEQLQAVCASYGISYEEGDRKSALIGRIEAARYKHEPQMLLEGGKQTLALTDGSKGEGKAKGKGVKRGRADDDDDDDDDEEEEYRPEEAGAVKTTKNKKKSKNQPAAAPAATAKATSAAAAAAAAAAPPIGPRGQAARGLVKARRTADGGMEYKVRWQGCEKEEDTWLSSTALPPKMIARFEKKIAEKKKALQNAATS